MPRTMTEEEEEEEERQRIYNLGRPSIPCTNGWRPIETAPKDCQILAYGIWRYVFSQEDEEPSIKIVEYICEYWHVAGFGYAELSSATHWQPLPKPPPE